MPQNKLERIIFALMTVFITVHAYVFYSLYVVNGATLMEVNHASGVLAAIAQQGGVYMLGHFLPIWAVVLVEFCLAFCLEITMGSPASFKLGSTEKPHFRPKSNKNGKSAQAIAPAGG